MGKRVVVAEDVALEVVELGIDGRLEGQIGVLVQNAAETTIRLSLTNAPMGSASAMSFL